MSVERYFSVEPFVMGSSIAIEKVLSRIDRIGMRSRTAVSKSIPVKPMALSPQTLMHSRSGWASLAPIAGPRPWPSCVVLPQPMSESGVTDRQKGESWSRELPASWVMIVSATSTVRCRSHSTRQGDSGTSALVSFGIHFAIQAARTVAISWATAMVGRGATTRRSSSASSASSVRAASPARPTAASRSLLRWSGSSVAWITVRPLGIATAKDDSVNEPPIPRITSALSRKCRTAKGIAAPPAPTERGCVSGKADLPSSEVTTGSASRSASALSCGQARA
jgi:hypothetical protein